MKKYIVALTALFLFSFSANAFFIEPYAGYGFSSYEQKDTDGGVYDGDANGTGFGLRLGYSLPLVFFGLDGFYALPKVDGDLKGDAKLTSFGVVAGVAIPIGIRLWAGYNFLTKLDVDQDAADENLEYEGPSYKAGVGFRIIPLLYVNAEYIINDFEEFNGESFSDAGIDEFDNSVIFVSLSVPISF